MVQSVSLVLLFDHYVIIMSTAHTIRYVIKTVFITLSVFIFLYVFFYILDTLYLFSISKKNSDAFQYGISNDLRYLKERGDEVAQSQLVIESLLKRDSSSLITYLRAEREHRGIGLMGVADSNGIIIGRTKTSSKRGDNVFLTNPVGIIVAQGRSAQSVEAPIGFDPRQILVTTGRPIFLNGKMIGALFANYLTDDIYARRFKYSYLPKGTEIVFYNKKGGIYGVSFTDEEVSKYIRGYFEVGSPWLQDGLSDQIMTLDNKTYLIKNIIFPGLKSSPGGVLLFISRRDMDGIARAITILITSLMFGCFVLRYYRYMKEYE